uniref:Uncharacterized protein n=1 Tax=Cacopsylla melanoneura TaxID=428564 RepID=A0A8D8XTD2_9HEMI
MVSQIANQTLVKKCRTMNSIDIDYSRTSIISASKIRVSFLSFLTTIEENFKRNFEIFFNGGKKIRFLFVKISNKKGTYLNTHFILQHQHFVLFSLFYTQPRLFHLPLVPIR